jgi:hypothetical protein
MEQASFGGAPHPHIGALMAHPHITHERKHQSTPPMYQNTTGSTPKASEVREYLDRYELEKHIQAALNRAVKGSSQNPLITISEYLRDAHIQLHGDVAVGVPQPAAPSAPRPRAPDGPPPDGNAPVAVSYLYTPSFAKAFARWDKNGDGKIDLEELRDVLLDIGAPARPSLRRCARCVAVRVAVHCGCGAERTRRRSAQASSPRWPRTC